MVTSRATSPVTVAIITRNRRAELARTLDRLAALPERPPVIVVDNASTDGTPEEVARDHPGVVLIRARGNLGAVGRNVAVRWADTPYVAFCDDDTWWDPGALPAACAVLAEFPEVATVTGRLLVEPGGREDPICEELRRSPVRGGEGLPGPLLLGILAGATVVRAGAFRAVGGFSPRLWFGGEEELLALDLAARGWRLLYADDVVVHHEASARRSRGARLRAGLRNTLWCAWLRRPAGRALAHSARVLAQARPRRDAVLAAAAAVRGLPWVLRERRVLPPEVERDLRAVERVRRAMAGRRYVR